MLKALDPNFTRQKRRGVLFLVESVDSCLKDFGRIISVPEHIYLYINYII